MSKSPIVPVKYWSDAAAGAQVIRTQGLRVVLFYTTDGHPTMYVDRDEGAPPSEATEYEDELMMRWNRAVLEQIKAASRGG